MSIVSLLEGGEYRHIKAINNNNTKQCVTTGFLLPSTSFLLSLYILVNTKHSDMVMKMNIKECPGHFSFVLTVLYYTSSEMISSCAAKVNLSVQALNGHSWRHFYPELKLSINPSLKKDGVGL